MAVKQRQYGSFCYRLLIFVDIIFTNIDIYEEDAASRWCLLVI
ncbi:MAG: hypothetical protein V7L11_31945 [Nostoc sp.]